MKKLIAMLALAAALVSPASAVAQSARPAPAETEKSDQRRINVNTADQAALESLPGVGPAKARAIVEDRAKNGPYKTVEELLRVAGIGAKTLEKIRPHVSL